MRQVRNAALAALLLIVLLIPVPAYGVKTIGLSSGTFRFDVSPGKSGKGEVVVMNEGDEAINVLVYVADQVVDDVGNVDFVTPNRDSMQQALSGPSSWVRVEMPARSKAIGNTPFLVLKPGEEVPVKFSFEVPPETPSGDHNTVLFFEMFSLEDVSQGVASKVYGRVGSRLKMRVKGPVVERLEAAPFWTEAFVIGDTVPFRFTVSNSGNIDKRIRASMTLLDRSEDEVYRSQVVTDGVVYAGTQRVFGGDMLPAKAAFGRLTARLTIDYQRETGEAGAASIVKERTVWILPLWAVIGAAALLVLIVFWAIWRLAMRAARRRLRKQRERSLRRRAEREERIGTVPGAGSSPADGGTDDRSRSA